MAGYLLWKIGKVLGGISALALAGDEAAIIGSFWPLILFSIIQTAVVVFGIKHLWRIVNGEFIQGDAWEAFALVAREIINQEGSGAGASIGDHRTYSVEGLTSLLDANSGFDEPITIKDFILHLDGLIEQVKEFLFITYIVGRISPSGLETLNPRTMKILKSLLCQDGTILCSFGLRLVICKKKAG